MDKVSLENFLNAVPVGNEEQVSCEGLVSAVGDLFRNIKHGRKERINANEWRGDIERKLKATYLNPNWLSKRRLVTGDVTIKAAQNGGLLEEDYKRGIQKMTSALNRVAAKNKGVVKKALDRVMPAIKFLDNRSNWKDSAKAAELYGQFKKISASLEFTDVDELEGIGEAAKLTVLTSAEVVETANLILSLIDLRVSTDPFAGEWESAFYTTFEDTLFSKFDAEHGIISEIEHAVGEDSDVVRLAHEMDSYQRQVEAAYGDTAVEIFENPTAYMKALIAYIDACVR